MKLLMRGLGRLGRLREVRQVGVRAALAIVGQVRVRAKASECMELGMWGRL